MSGSGDDAAAAAAAKLKALRGALAPLDDVDDATTPAQLCAALKVLGQEVPEAAATAMLAYSRSEANERTVAAGEVQSRAVDDGDVDKGIGAARMLVERDCHRDAPLRANGKTVAHVVLDAFTKHAAEPCLGVRTAEKPGEFTWRTYAQVRDDVRAYVAGMRALCGDDAAPQAMIGMAATTRVDWSLLFEGNQFADWVTVTIYPTLGEASMAHIVKQTKLRVLVCDVGLQSTFAKMLASQPAAERSVRHVIVSAAKGDAAVDAAAWKAALGEDGAAAIKFHTFADVLKAGASATDESCPLVPPADDDRLAMLLYTSGTTGDPKGVMITHRGYAKGVVGLFGPNMALDAKVGDRMLAHLPMAHVSGMLLEAASLMHGAAIGFYSQDPKLLVEDMAVLKSTIVATVPRVLGKLVDGISAKVRAAGDADPMKKAIIGWGVEAKERRRVERGRVRSLWDFVAFKTVRDALGGAVRMVATGASPISVDTLKFFHIYFGARTVQLYGMSEVWLTNGCYPEDVNGLHTVGPPALGVQIRLESVDDMGYSVKDDPPRGEVCFKGPNVMRGYYNRDDLTAEAIVDGWMHSGDIGVWEPNGCLRIIDRKKNIFKLAQGEYVSPEKVENVLILSPLIAQAFVHGDSLRAELVAVLVLDPDVVPLVCKKNDWQCGDNSLAAQCTDERVRAAAIADAGRLAKEQKLFGFETPRAFRFSTVAFDVANDLLTPTFKLKRHTARKFFAPQITEMYAEIDAAAAK